jgi:tetratricopeptide (TPR) repeat protein
LAEEGRVAESRSLGQEALNGAHQVSDQQGIGLSEALLAHLLAVEGKFPESLLGYKEAVRILRDVGSPVDLATTLLDFGDAQMEAGDTAGARMSYEEVRDLDRQHGNFAKPEVAMAFARLNLAAGKTEDAASGARAAMNAFAAAGREGDRLRAATLLASALIARGNRGEAAQVIAQIPSPDGRPLPIDAAVHFRLARCLVDANAGRRAEADRAMDAITAEVSRLGLPPLEKETRLARLAMMKNR